MHFCSPNMVDLQERDQYTLTKDAAYGGHVIKTSAFKGKFQLYKELHAERPFLFSLHLLFIHQNFS